MWFSKKKSSKNKESHSVDFETFLHDYFTGHPMIRGRLEEDCSVWDRLNGAELERAKIKILENLPFDKNGLIDNSYIRAAGIFKDERAIPKLRTIADKGKSLYDRASAARVLFDWVGYDGYFELIDQIYAEKGDGWSKISLIRWINGMEEQDALRYFWIAINDPESFVRFCAFGDLERYYGVWKFRDSGSVEHYYTEDDVYNDKALFVARKTELEQEIKKWREQGDRFP